MKKLSFLFICLLFTIPAQARTITVDANGSADFNNIQAAVDDSNDGDIIEVQPGTYTGPGNRDLHFNQGVPLTVRSEFGPVNCIIDCEREGRGFIFSDPNMDPNYVVDGFTITGGCAEVGGAIYCEASSPRITNCRIINNKADHGGGIYCTGVSAMIITNTEISNNHSDGFGGAVYCEAEAEPEIINCLITHNESTDIGGSFYLYESSAVINLCTIVYNTGLDYGDFDDDLRPYGPKGGICTREADPEVTNCIIWGNGDDLYGGEGESVDVTFCCIEDLIDSDEDEGSDNIGEDPLFISGGLGDFYLFQEHPDPLQNSPCVNAGEQYILIDLQQEYNLGEVTTSVLNSEDLAYTDIGFHYPLYDGPPIEYKLEIIVTGDGNVDYRIAGDVLIGNVDPTSSPVVDYFTPGTVIRLDAFAESEHWGYWSGSDDDTSFNTWNTVTMYGDRTISVDFRLIKRNTIYVPDQHPLLQDAIDNAGYGDIIMLAPIKEGGEPYRTSQGFVIRDNKVITISSIDPCDPCVVAATVIEMQGTVDDVGWVDTAFTFVNVGPNTILDGITIRGFTFQGRIGDDGDEDAPAGENGAPSWGGAIVCYMASPTIKNCIIVDCNVMGGDGGDGASGDDDHLNGWAGGWPGGAYGGGLACLAGFDWRTAEWVGDHWENITIVPSNPTVINCTFDNCAALGGNGGDGGNGNETPMGLGGRGGGWFYGVSSIWYNVPWPHSYSYIEPWFWEIGDGSYGFYDFYTKYSGLGGAAYVGPECSARFIGCTFTNNRSEGGLCGICGQDEGDLGRYPPGLHWKIDNFGGAVYCDVNSLVEFDNCKFVDNLADPNRPIRDYNEPQSEENYANDDSFVGFGGAVAFRDDVNVDFNNCTFNGNAACEGGAMYWVWSDPLIGDCNFANNSAGSGGAVLCIGGSGRIARSAFTGNTATGLFARGGAICSLGTNAMIVDCNISYNDAVGSGGGIYISSRGISGVVVSNYSEITVKNCLITNNFAGKDGGGISANWYSDPNIINCTIADNAVTGGDGGGIFCSYGNYTNIINSIIWGNSAEDGDQIAIGISYKPSTASVSYSNVQGGEPGVYVEGGCMLNWGDGNIEEEPCFVDADSNDYHLLEDSPCIDAGDPNYVAEPNETDLDGLPRIIGPIIDMGAYEFRPPILAIVDIHPQTLNLQSRGVITAFIELPEPYSVDDIDLETVECEGASAIRGTIANDTLIVKFERRDLQDIEPGQDVEFMVTGELTDGTVFEGTDVIRVIDKGGKK